METKKTYKRVGTHDGRFHADEVMATAILQQIFELEVIRTRDLERLKELDIVYDVGRGEFDHHGVEKVYRADGIPYAASGLIWNKYGKEVVSFFDSNLEEREIESVFNFVDRTLIKGIDALDNGLRPMDSDIRVMSIVAIISSFNPSWDSENMERENFDEAVRLACTVLKKTIEQRLAVLRAKDIVKQAYDNRMDNQVLILDIFCPYREVLRRIDEDEDVVYVIYPKENGYAIETVRGKGGKDKRPLPEEWAGKEDQDLIDITGVHDAVFCHAGRFMAVAKSYEGILKLAELTLNSKEKAKDKSLFRFSPKFIKERGVF